MLQSSCSTQNKTEATTTQRRKSAPGDVGQGVDFQRGPNVFRERKRAPTRAALVCLDLQGHMLQRSAAARKSEFEGLAQAIHLDVIFSDLVRLREVRPATYLGGGTVETLAERVEAEDVELVLIDAPLSPVQQRNLERLIGAKVLDRTALILEIFGERAATREGVLQVELAHLNYQKGRLVRSWTHLERQRGGGGFLGGPGETQIESDRRKIRERISVLEKRIGKVMRTRSLQRKPRDAVPFPVVAIVGYTNAGKSSIFNRVTGSAVKAQDLLFATLDTTVRRARLPHGRDIILSDTVGFIADLPTDLVAAFRATLEEVTQADIILHVRDISNPDHTAQAIDVLSVLADLGIGSQSTPIIEAWNKIDKIERFDGDSSELANILPAGPVEASIAVSAQSGEGIDALLEAIETCLAKGSRVFRIAVPHARGGDIGWIYDHGEVIARGDSDEASTELTVRVQPRFNEAFHKRFGKRLVALDPA